jgi:hypothetical protein
MNAGATWWLGQSHDARLIIGRALSRRCPGRVNTGALLAGNPSTATIADFGQLCPSHQSWGSVIVHGH